MGRSNKKRRAQNKPHKPTLSQEEKNKLGLLSDMESGDREIEQIQNLLDVLCSQRYDEDIIYALATLSSFVAEEKGGKLFLRLNGTERVSGLLLHTSKDVREKTVGTLRNVLITCGDNCIRSYIEHDVPNNIVHIFKEIHKVVVDGTMSLCNLKSKEMEVCEFLCDALDFFTSLCESPMVVDVLDVEFLLKFFVYFIGAEDTLGKLRIKAAQCLYVISEDNKILTDLVMTIYPWIIETYMQVKPEENQTLVIYRMGILYNLSCLISLEKIDLIHNEIIQYIGVCLNDVVSVLKSGTYEEEGQMSFCTKLDNLKFGFELFSNIICHDKDGSEEEWDEVDDCDLIDEDGDGHSSINMNDVEESKYVDLFEQIDLTKNIIFICGYSSNNLPEGRWLATYQRCWQFVSNFVSIARPEILSENELIELWKIISNLIISEAGDLQNHKNEMIDAISCAMRAVIEKMISYEQYHVVCTADVVTMVSKLFNSETSASSKMNLISIMGMIGKHVCTNQNTANVLEGIAHVFAAVLNSDSKDVLLIAEVLDASFDSFADGPCVNEILATTGLLTALKNISAGMNSLTKEAKRIIGDKIGIVSMARTNLIRFIKYKEKR